MKTKFFIIAIAAVSFSLFSCNNSNTNNENRQDERTVNSDNSRNSLDWNGTYSGTVPCADCEGIFTIVRLNNDDTYTVRTKYLGKDEDFNETTGSFSWDNNGNIITFNNTNNNEGMNKFQIEEGKITMLDTQGNRITGTLANNYILTKVKDNMVEKYWKLKELNGEEVKWDGQGNREPHMILRVEDNRVNGSGGCNTFMGSYEIKDNDKITFSRMASTMRACPDMNIENRFINIFETVDNYKVDDKNLELRDSNNNTLAKFEVVYM